MMSRSGYCIFLPSNRLDRHQGARGARGDNAKLRALESKLRPVIELCGCSSIGRMSLSLARDAGRLTLSMLN